MSDEEIVDDNQQPPQTPLPPQTIPELYEVMMHMFAQQEENMQNMKKQMEDMGRSIFQEITSKYITISYIFSRARAIDRSTIFKNH